MAASPKPLTPLWFVYRGRLFTGYYYQGAFHVNKQAIYYPRAVVDNWEYFKGFQFDANWDIVSIDYVVH